MIDSIEAIIIDLVIKAVWDKFGTRVRIHYDDDIVTDFVSFYVRGSFVCSVYVSDEHLFLDYASDMDMFDLCNPDPILLDKITNLVFGYIDRWL